MVPRAAFTRVTGRLRKELTIPLITSNRINTPEVAEAVLASGDADIVSMGRPMLADPEFVLKAQEGREDEINTCIACNQACMDFALKGKIVSCLVNPRAGHETELVVRPAEQAQSIAVVGAGPAGLAYSVTAAERGHKVTLFDRAGEIGGQFNLAKRIPGKEEFYETLRYYRTMIAKLGIDLRLGAEVTADMLEQGGFDRIVLATGVEPRQPAIEGIDHPSVVSYVDVVAGRVDVGQDVVIIGAGGIGFDVAELVTHSGPSAALDIDLFAQEWGIDFANHPRGGVTGVTRVTHSSGRRVTVIQRKPSKPGRTLGASTGWTRKLLLQRRGVEMVAGADYLSIDDHGLHTLVSGEPRLFPADTIIICAGQDPSRTLFDALAERGMAAELVGGAYEAAELDARRAIDQATKLALTA